MSRYNPIAIARKQLELLAASQSWHGCPLDYFRKRAIEALKLDEHNRRLERDGDEFVTAAGRMCALVGLTEEEL